MEAAATLGSAANFFSVPDSASRCRLFLSHRSQFGAQLPKHRSSISLLSNGSQCQSPVSKRNSRVQASSGDSGEVSPTPIAPLQMESPVGQFLSQILANHPHLLAAAIDQQLHQLQSDRDAMEATSDASASSTDLVLYRRIAEVKANERRRTLEEILYALVVQKFMDAGVSLVPTISQPSGKPGKVEHWSSEEEKLRMLHSPEAYEMIKNHLSLILGQKLESPDAVAPISKLRVGQVYAASIMYGYFLKRVDQRFQLEKTMKTLPCGSDGEVDPGSSIQQAVIDESQSAADVSAVPSASFGVSGFADRIKPCRLRSYVMSFDTETLQRCATIRSKEAFSIIEKHTEALFGRPEIVITPEGTIDSSKDELIKISFAGLKRLILEAVTFGSFLWDVESYVDSRYHFVMG